MWGGGGVGGWEGGGVGGWGRFASLVFLFFFWGGGFNKIGEGRLFKIDYIMESSLGKSEQKQMM